METQEILNDIINKYGRDILSNPKKLSSLLLDYDNNNEIFKSQIFKFCLSQNFLSSLLNINKRNAEVISNKLLTTLTSSGFDTQKSEQIINMFLQAFGISYQLSDENTKATPVQTDSNSTPSPTSSSTSSTSSTSSSSSTNSFSGDFLYFDLDDLIDTLPYSGIFAFISGFILTIYTLISWFQFYELSFLELISSTGGIVFLVIFGIILLALGYFFWYEDSLGIITFIIITILAVGLDVGILALGWYLNSLLYPLDTTIFMIFPIVLAVIAIICSVFFNWGNEGNYFVPSLISSTLLCSITPIIIIVCHHLLH